MMLRICPWVDFFDCSNGGGDVSAPLRGCEDYSTVTLSQFVQLACMAEAKYYLIELIRGFKILMGE